MHRVAGGRCELAHERATESSVIASRTRSPVRAAPWPLHNQIPEPDRALDNTTIWQADYNRAHYERIYFSDEPGADTMLNYYRAQSSGRYGFTGGVVDWVRVRFNEARYGTNLCGSNVCSTVWALVRDAINVWTLKQLADGMTPNL